MGLDKTAPLPVRYGVPQVSILGPLLFSIYINDLPLSLNCSCEIFADDTSVLVQDPHPDQVSKKLQNVISSIVEWTKLNHMALNVNKTKCMYPTTRQKRQKMITQFSNLMIDNQQVEEVISHKVLGVTIDNDLTWTQHITLLGRQLSQKIYQLAKIKNFLDLSSRKLFFHGHFLSLLNYASTIWDNASDTNLKLLNRLHKRAVKLVLLKTSSPSKDDYIKVDILPFKCRMKFNKLMLMYNVAHGNVPQRIQRNFIMNRKRHKHLLSYQRPKNNLYKSSLTVSGSNIWNDLPPPMKTIHTKKLFKKKLKEYLFSTYKDP